MSILHQKAPHKYCKGKRDPAILELKKAFIEENKDDMHTFFVTEQHDWKAMHRKYPNSKYYSPPALELAHKIKEVFGYKSKPTDILNHFKRLFLKMYPGYEFSKVKQF